MIRTVLFDMGNVLLHFSHQKMCRQMGRLCGRDEDDIRRRVMASGAFDEFERGDLDKPGFHRRFERIVETTVDADALMRAVSDIFVPNESIVPVVRRLKSRGLRLVLLSNTNAAHFEFIRANYRILDAFDALALSYEARSMKPDEGIYAFAFELADCAPEECYFTDDRVENVEQARRRGWHAEQFTTTDALRTDLARMGIALDG